jgi:hypothetical protein
MLDRERIGREACPTAAIIDSQSVKSHRGRRATRLRCWKEDQRTQAPCARPALTNWVIAGARSQPLVLALEDMHWADPTTLDLLRGIAERGALAPLFILITARPEFRPPWGMRSHHGMIALAPLDRQQVRDMVAELSARHALPKEVVDGVTERTGGVPLFVEEVTRLLLERGEQGGIQAIPPTLQQSLTARLDRLGPAREVAQISAVIGRDFPYALLRAVAGMSDVALQAALERLAEADILLVQGLPRSRTIASNTRSFRTSFLRWPNDATPMSLRSSLVSRPSSSMSMSLARNISAYWAKPAPRSQPSMSKFSLLGSCQRQFLKKVESLAPAVIPRGFLNQPWTSLCGHRPLDNSIAAPSRDTRPI